MTEAPQIVCAWRVDEPKKERRMCGCPACAFSLAIPTWTLDIVFASTGDVEGAPALLVALCSVHWKRRAS